MFCHGCEGMHGIARRDLFFFFFFSSSCYGISRGDGEEWECFFLLLFFVCPPLSAFCGRTGKSVCGSTEDNT